MPFRPAFMGCLSTTDCEVQRMAYEMEQYLNVRSASAPPYSPAVERRPNTEVPAKRGVVVDFRGLWPEIFTVIDPSGSTVV